jgi:hypothetical protein
MQPTAKRLLLSALAAGLVSALVPSLASAQPGGPPPPPPPGGYGGGGGYYGPPPYYPPPPPPPTTRRGLTLGFGFGLGGMSADSGELCADCDYDPIAFGFDFHIGGMINPQMAILGEFTLTGQTLDADGFSWVYQSMALAGLQYWLTPQFWLKGGIGFSQLDIQYDDGFVVYEETVDTGVGVLGAIGYEVLHSTRFAIDLALRLQTASYDAVDNSVNSAIFGIGFNWY